MDDLFLIPAGLPGPEEFSEILVRRGEIIVERIVSHGHASAPGTWFDQEKDEQTTSNPPCIWIAFHFPSQPT